MNEYKKVLMKNETEIPIRCVLTLKIKHMVHSGPIKLLLDVI